MSYFDEFDPTPNEEYLEAAMEEIEILKNQNKKLKEKLKEATNILKDGCQVYDQHVPSGSSSFRSDAQWFLDTALKEVENEANKENL